MPKAATVTKEMIVDSAFEIVRREGFGSLSARNVAKRIGCSTQPIYWVYRNMDDLKQDVISKMLVFLNQQLVDYKKTGKPFLDYGLGYVYVAYSEPVLFKALYVDNILGLRITDVVPEKTMLEIMKQDSGLSSMPDKSLLETANRAWFLVHGIATMVSVGMLVYDEDRIEEILLGSI